MNWRLRLFYAANSRVVKFNESEGVKTLYEERSEEMKTRNVLLVGGVLLAVAVIAGCVNTETRPFVTDVFIESMWEGDSTNELKVAVTLVGNSIYTYCVTNGGAMIVGPNQKVELYGSPVGARFVRAVFPAPTEVLAIPAFLNGYPVTSIGKFAFANCAKVKSVTIPEGVTSIEGSAFSRCDRLESVIIPSTVTSIGYYAFGSCRNLKSVTILSEVTSIEASAFRGCTGLKSVVIPKGATVAHGAFSEGCKVQRK